MAVNMTHGEQAKVGVFGIGLAAYWPQFHGLKERLEGYQRKVEERLGEWATVVSAGLVDDAPKAEEAAQAFLCERVDLVFCYVGTYATSSQVLPVVQKSKTPVVVLNLQPSAALDYAHTDTGEWLAHCSACCVPEISCAFARSAIPFQQVTGMLEPEPDVREPSELAWAEIREWCEAAKVIHNLRKSRIGFLGHPYPGMLDMYSDFTQHQAQLGTHIEVLEMCDLDERVRAATRRRVGARRPRRRGPSLTSARTVLPIPWPRSRRRRRWTGPAAWRWVSIAWWRISTLTEWRIITVARRGILTSGSGRA